MSSFVWRVGSAERRTYPLSAGGESVSKTEQTIEFSTERSTCRGVFTAPAIDEANGLTVVVCPGLGGTRDGPVVQSAVRGFNAAGFAVFAFDYSSFGDSDGTPRQVAGVALQIEEVVAAVKAVARHSRVDANRVALWGTSLGGAHAIAAASRHPVRGVVAQLPFVGVANKSGLPGTMRFAAAAVSDRIRRALRLEPHYIPLVGAVGSTAAMTNAEPERVLRLFDGTSWCNKVSAGVLLDLVRYWPAEYVAGAPPLLLCVGEDDPMTPGYLVDEVVAAAPTCEVKTLPVGHFELEDGVHESAWMAAQVDFLERVMAI